MYVAKASPLRVHINGMNTRTHMQTVSLVGSPRASGPRTTRLQPVGAMENLDWASPAMEIVKLAGPTVTLVLFGLNQNRQMGKMEARQHAFKKALAKQETTIEKGFAAQKLEFEKGLAAQKLESDKGFAMHGSALKEAVNLLRSDTILLSAKIDRIGQEVAFLRGVKSEQDKQEAKR
jgi:hypothetical protein